MALCASLLTAPCLVSAQETGWNTVLRPTPLGPGQINFLPNGDYDWTGLVDKAIQYDDQGYIVYQDALGLFGGVYYPDISLTFGYDYPLNFDIVGGASTYKWKWQAPPNLDPIVTDPDIKNFPAPKLFTLGTLMGGYGVSQNPGTLGLSADSFIGYLNGLTSQVSTTIPAVYALRDYKILPSAYDAPTQTATSVLPVRAEFTEASDGQADSGAGQSNFSLFTQISPIGLLYPDPFKRPDALLDGGNQYVYDTLGDLYLDAEIFCDDAAFSVSTSVGSIPPTAAYSTSIAAAGKYLAKVTNWKTDIPVSDTNYQIYPLTVPDASIHTYLYPYFTAGSVANSGFDPAVVPYSISASGKVDTSHLVFEGLPFSNDDFGNHKVTLQVGTPTAPPKSGDAKKGGAGRQPTLTANDSQAAYIQTFYNPDDSAYPGAAAAGDPNYQSNWVHYYTQTLRQYYGFPDKVVYGGVPGGALALYDPNTDTIQIGTRANSEQPLHLFALPIPGAKKQFIRWIGDVEINGILTYTTSFAHENTHRQIFFAPQRLNMVIGVPNVAQSGVDNGDSDGLDDNWEISHYFDPTSPDTTGAYPYLSRVPGSPPANSDIGKADRECVCDMVAYGDLLRVIKAELWKKDWAVNGMQWGPHYPHPAAPVGVYYPVTYKPLLTIGPPPTFDTPTSKLPDNALTSYPPHK